MFLVCLSFNSLSCYFAGKQSDSFGKFLKAFVVGIRSKSCLFLSESIQSKLENYGKDLSRGFSKWSPEQHRHYHLGTGPYPSEGPPAWLKAVALFKFLISSSWKVRPSGAVGQWSVGWCEQRRNVRVCCPGHRQPLHAPQASKPREPAGVGAQCNSQHVWGKSMMLPRE